MQIESQAVEMASMLEQCEGSVAALREIERQYNTLQVACSHSWTLPVAGNAPCPWHLGLVVLELLGVHVSTCHFLHVRWLMSVTI